MYEILCLISSNDKKGAMSSLVTKIEEVLKNSQAQIVYKNDMGEKKLAYPIKHEKNGYYLAIGFELVPNLLSQIEKKLKNIPEILRYQIIKVKPFQKEEKKERGKEEKKEKIDFEKLEEKIDKILADEDKLIK